MKDKTKKKLSDINDAMVTSAFVITSTLFFLKREGSLVGYDWGDVLAPALVVIAFELILLGVVVIKAIGEMNRKDRENRARRAQAMDNALSHHREWDESETIPVIVRDERPRRRGRH